MAKQYMKRFYIEITGSNAGEVEEAEDAMSDAALAEADNAGFNVTTEYGNDDIEVVTSAEV